MYSNINKHLQDLKMTSASNSGVVGDGEGEIVARLSTDEWVVVQVRGHAWIASLLYILLLFFVIHMVYVNILIGEILSSL